MYELCKVKMISQVKLIKMKKIMFSIMAACILMSFAPVQLKAENEKNSSSAVTTDVNTTEATKTSVATEVNSKTATEIDETAEAKAELTRLEEIKVMDMSTLTPEEKKELREEVHMIQNQQDRRDRDRDRNDNDGPRRHHGGGIIFLGGGGLLLLILILLLL
jgi:hypothetical protein